MSTERSALRREDLPLAERLQLPLLTADELAVHLALASGEGVNVLAQRREIPFVRVGKRNLFRLDDAIAALWKKHVATMSEAEIRAYINVISPPRRMRPQRPSTEKESHR
ncbi:MAG: hypothetical protein HYR85_08125 [Planctomycetes bacterium]|nr:hypothetical protein [Planctomycetota bacterium]MBI3843246.1 hypothetical protein [Planctomycetota bacterium]